jgi:GNAT superfamily N-acetyltransferase
MLTYRYSHEGDEKDVYSILMSCFGHADYNSATKNINGRYLMCFDGSIPVGLTGLGWSKTHKCMEVDYTAVIYSYRKRGIPEELFRRLISSTDERIICYCWRIGDKQINMHKVMEKFGFKLVLKDSMRLKYGYNCGLCAGSCRGYYDKNCECAEDMYELSGR